eukprot:373088_1
MLWSRLTIGRFGKSKKIKALFGLVLLLFARYASLKIHRKMCRLCPGPIGIPILGSLFSLAKDAISFYNSCVSQYGPLCMYYMGMTPIILISDPLILKELYKNKHTLARKKIAENKYTNDPKGIKWSNNVVLMHDVNRWKKLRKLHYTTIITLLNSKLIENITLKHMNKYIFTSINQTIDNNNLWYPHKHTFHSTFNVFFGASFGELLHSDDKNMLSYIDNVQKRFEVGGLIVLLGTMNLAWFIPTKWTKKNTKLQLNSADIMIQWYKQYLNVEIDPYSNKIEKINDVIVNNSLAFQSFINIALDKNNNITAENVIMESDTFFTGGLENASETAEYSLLLLAKYPKVQKDCYLELIEIFGKDGDFELSKVNKCSKLRAFVHESIRIRSGSITSIPRIATAQIKIREYVIPKNGILVPYLYHCNKYDKKWIYPAHELHLNNWLDSNGKFKMNELFVAFSTGKRDCIGKAFAKNYLCAFVANLLLKYQFKAKNDQDFEIKQRAHFMLVIDGEIGLRVTKR